MRVIGKAGPISQSHHQTLCDWIQQECFPFTESVRRRGKEIIHYINANPLHPAAAKWQGNGQSRFQWARIITRKVLSWPNSMKESER